MPHTSERALAKGRNWNIAAALLALDVVLMFATFEAATLNVIDGNLAVGAGIAEVVAFLGLSCWLATQLDD